MGTKINLIQVRTVSGKVYNVFHKSEATGQQLDDELAGLYLQDSGYLKIEEKDKTAYVKKDSIESFDFIESREDED